MSRNQSKGRGLKHGLPDDKKREAICHTANISSPLGEIAIYATEKGVCFLKFADHIKGELILQQVLKQLSGRVEKRENPHICQAQQELNEYFDGKRTHFQTPLDIVGTAFQKSAWKVLQNIAYGTTVSYREQAKQLGREQAVRAVANANGRNRISIIIPCHRVIGSDGSLTGYGGGLERKRWLLAFERRLLKSQT